jgi:hypothetical protein
MLFLRDMDERVEGRDQIERAWRQLDRGHVADQEPGARHLSPGDLNALWSQIDPSDLQTTFNQVCGGVSPGTTAQIEHLSRWRQSQLEDPVNVTMAEIAMAGRGPRRVRVIETVIAISDQLPGFVSVHPVSLASSRAMRSPTSSMSRRSGVVKVAAQPPYELPIWPYYHRAGSLVLLV